MKIYECQFPGCDFKHVSRKHFNYHHIIPKARGGSDAPKNRILLCARCHTFIHVEGETTGIHSLGKDDIILLGYRMSTEGRLIEWKKVDNEDINYSNIKEKDLRIEFDKETRKKYIDITNKKHEVNKRRKKDISELNNKYKRKLRRKIDISELINS